MNFLKNIKHIIWDWNGTLVDDVHLCVGLINEILRSRSLPDISIPAYRNTFDFPVIDFYKRVGFDLEKDSFEELSDQFISGYKQSRKSLILHSGAIEALNFFKQRELPQCMLSASQLDALQETLHEHKIASYFKTVLGLDHHYAHGKVHLGKLWLRQNHIERTRVLLIGDTLHDLKVADEMGIHCILVTTGHHSHGRLKAGHCCVVDNLEKLIKKFKDEVG